MTYTHRFDGPIVQARKRVHCENCGRVVRRVRTFQHTVNPFNKRDDGQPKTWDEVREDVKAEAEAWKQRPERCKTCGGTS